MGVEEDNSNLDVSTQFTEDLEYCVAGDIVYTLTSAVANTGDPTPYVVLDANTNILSWATQDVYVQTTVTINV